MINVNKTRYILSLIGAFVFGMMLVGTLCALKIGSVDFAYVKDDKITQIKENIDKFYLNDYKEEDLIEGACKGYVQGLGDPYTVYMNAEEYETWMTSTIGDYSGVGITFSKNDDGYYVVQSINPNSPASETEISEGDYILTVDGKTYDDSDVMAAKIRGREGTSVTLEIYHNGDTKKITMIRKQILLESVTYEMLDGNVGYIKISSFLENTGNDFKNALDAVEAKGAKSLILDLRDNGGGLVDQCVKVADEFLDKGVVCYTEDKNGTRNSYTAEDGKTDLRTVILINENSASASEILAGALKDNGFELVGTKSFGKGVIQSTIEMKDGSALKITIMQYLSPNENVIDKKGVKPNYRVKDKEKTEKDEQLEKAKELLK